MQALRQYFDGEQDARTAEQGAKPEPTSGTHNLMQLHVCSQYPV